METKCIFCNIARKVIPAKIVYEDEFAVGFLDIRPRSKGMCIVASRQHLKDPSENPDISSKIFNSAVALSEKIKKALEPIAISISLMPSEVQHFHLRIYPFYKDDIPLVETQPKEMSEGELEIIAQKIREEVKEKKPVEEEKIEEKEEKPKRTEEDIFWIKRELEVA